MTTSVYINFSLRLATVLSLCCIGCRTPPVNTENWSASASMALALSTMPAHLDLPLPLYIASRQLPAGGMVTLGPRATALKGSGVCTQMVDLAESSVIRRTKWSGEFGQAERVASDREKTAIIAAFIWMQMRDINEPAYVIDVSLDDQGGIAVGLISIPYTIGGHYFFYQSLRGFFGDP